MYTGDKRNHFFVQILKYFYLQLTDLIIRSINLFIRFFEGLHLRAYSVPDTVSLAELAQLSNVRVQGDKLWHVKIEAFCFVF